MDFGARTRTISILTGMPLGIVVRHVFGAGLSSAVGRPPYAEEFVFRATLAVQGEIGVFARAYRRLRAEGFPASRSLLAAYRQHANVFVPPALCFDEAFFLVSCLDGIWGARYQTLELHDCRTCGSPHVLPAGPGAGGQCALCKVSSKPHLHAPARRPAAQPPVPRDSVEIDRTIAVLRLQQAMEDHGADPRIINAVAPLKRAPGDEPVRCGRPLKLARWSRSVSAVQRIMYTSHALAFRRLVAAGFSPAEALASAYGQMVRRFGKESVPSFDRCFESISLLEALWGVTVPRLGLTKCVACGSHHLVSLVEETSTGCPVCEVVRQPTLFVHRRREYPARPASC